MEIYISISKLYLYQQMITIWERMAEPSGHLAYHQVLLSIVPKFISNVFTFLCLCCHYPCPCHHRSPVCIYVLDFCLHLLLTISNTFLLWLFFILFQIKPKALNLHNWVPSYFSNTVAWNCSCPSLSILAFAQTIPSASFYSCQNWLLILY